MKKLGFFLHLVWRFHCLASSRKQVSQRVSRRWISAAVVSLHHSSFPVSTCRSIITTTGMRLSATTMSRVAGRYRAKDTSTAHLFTLALFTLPTCVFQKPPFCLPTIHNARDRQLSANHSVWTESFSDVVDDGTTVGRPLTPRRKKSIRGSSLLLSSCVSDSPIRYPFRDSKTPDMASIASESSADF